MKLLYETSEGLDLLKYGFERGSTSCRSSCAEALPPLLPLLLLLLYLVAFATGAACLLASGAVRFAWQAMRAEEAPAQPLAQPLARPLVQAAPLPKAPPPKAASG